MEKTIITSNIVHDYNKQYKQFDIVNTNINNNTKIFLAIKNVPRHISILDEHYWKELPSEEIIIEDTSNLQEKVIEVNVTSIPNTIDSDKVYNYGELASNTTFPGFTTYDDDYAHIYCWTFSTGSTEPTIIWPYEITMWSGGEAPTIEAKTYYEIIVLNGLAVVNSYTDSE